MSADHTYMDSATFLANEREIAEWRSGNSQEMERARLRTEQALNEVRADSDRFLSSLSDSRRRNIEAITNASGRVAQSIASTTSSADETQRAMAGLDQAVKDAADSVARINAEMRAGANTAQALYAELTRQFAICETNPDYFKFAPREFASVQERVASLAGKTSGSAAIEMVCANALNDILLMDVKVARGRAVYHMQHLEAVKTAEKIKADIRQARTSFFDDLPAQEGELIDMDYWTHGQYKVLEDEVNRVSDAIEAGRSNPSYTEADLRRDAKRLAELDRIQQLLLVQAREQYNHSLNRVAQGQTCSDILQEDHGFQLVGEGFDHADRREAYVVRLRRFVDGAEVEVIVNQGSQPGEYEVYFRVDSTTFMDENLMRTINESIATDFAEAGVQMKMFRHCRAETLEPFNPGNITVNQNTRNYHGIQRRQPGQAAGL